MSNDNQTQLALAKVTPLEKIEIIRSHRIAINFAMMEIMQERKAIKLVASMTNPGQSREAFKDAEDSLLSTAIELANQLESIHNISA